MHNAFYLGMSIDQFNNATPSQTFTWMDARIQKRKADADNRDEIIYINRLNTFYIANSFGGGFKKPWDLYPLAADKDKTHAKKIDLFSDEMNELFDKF